MAKIITDEIAAKMKELEKEGVSQRNIAFQLGVTRDQVQHHLAKTKTPPHPQIPKQTMNDSEKYEPSARLRILQQINDDLEYRYKRLKTEIDELETSFKKVKNERDDLRIELKTFEAQKQLELAQINSSQKGGLNGLVDKLGDPNVLSSLPSVVQAFQMLMGKSAPAQANQLAGQSISLPGDISQDKASVLKFIVDSMAKMDDNKFSQLSTLVATVASTNAHDGWLNETFIAMTTPQPQQPQPSNPNKTA